MKILRKLRIEIIAGVLALVISAFFGLHVLNFAHRNESEREVWTGLRFWQTLEAFEYRLYDARISSRGKIVPPSKDKIAIVGIDENAFFNTSWPIPRSNYANLITRLKAAGARVIVIDVDFSSHQNSREDAALESAMEKAGNVLLVSYLTPERVEKNDEDVGLILRTTTPIERLDDWTPDIALAFIPLDSDNRARRYPLYADINNSTIGSVAALACASYQRILDHNQNKKYEGLLRTGRWPSQSAGVLRVPLVASLNSDDRSESETPTIFSTPLYFFGPQATFQTDSFLDVLNGNEEQYSPAGRKKKFDGKIVFVGATTHFLKDVFPVPSFAREAKTSLANDISIDQLPGVEIHATATAMLLDGIYIRTQSTPVMLLTLFGLTIGASLWAASLRHFVSRLARSAQVLWTKAKWRGQIHTPLWFGLYLFLGALPIALFWWYCNFAFQKNLWIIAAYPLLSASAVTAGVLLMLFSVESGTRRKTETLFSRAASPELLAKMLASGGDYLKPEVICVTVLFSDLEGFTNYSESHSPAEVIEVTNDFLSSVVPIIHKYDGWVDKYIGDAIMAVFGALVEREDHAQVALKCAVEIQDECAKWRKKTGVAFYMRVGIHTGEVIAGYMGSRESENSRERMDYTVIGDTVNLASRLEGKNKEYNSWIMCSAETFEAAPNVVAAHSVSALIKGKSKEVEVFIVTGLENEPERDKNWAKDVS